MSECHTICSFTLLLIRLNERVSFLADPSTIVTKNREREGEEEALNQFVISFSESHNSASYPSFARHRTMIRQHRRRRRRRRKREQSILLICLYLDSLFKWLSSDDIRDVCALMDDSRNSHKYVAYDCSRDNTEKKKTRLEFSIPIVVTLFIGFQNLIKSIGIKKKRSLDQCHKVSILRFWFPNQKKKNEIKQL
jgi:hypothetical protein